MSNLSVRRLEPLLFGLTGMLVAAVAVQVAYRTEPVVPLALAGALAAGALALWRPMVALVLSIALVPLELLSLKLGGLGVSPAEAMFAMTGAAWAVRRLAFGEPPFVPSPLNKPYVLLLLAIVPGLAITTDSVLVVKVLVIWSFFFMLFQLVLAEGDAETVRWVLLALAVAGAIVGVTATIRSGGGADVTLLGVGQSAEGRAQGSFGDPNTLATFEGLALPGALALAFYGRTIVRLVGAVSFALIFAGLALSLSRGGLLAVAGALAVMVTWAPVRRAVVVAGLVVVAFAIAGQNPIGEVQQVQTLSERVSSISYSARGVDPRFGIWERTPDIVADHPLFGVSMNGFPAVGGQYGLLGPDQTPYAHAHNIPLTIAAELGLLGLAAFTWLVVQVVRVLGRAYREGARSNRGLTTAVAAALVALALQGMVDYPLRLNAIVAVVFVLTGCAVVLSRRQEEPGVEPPPAGPAPELRRPDQRRAVAT